MRKQSMDFRKEEVQYVMHRWSLSQSCSLVGVGSIGKSNLVQHLADRDVQLNYIKHIKLDFFRAIIVDPNLLAPLPSYDENQQIQCWAGYELMMHRLFLAFYPFDVLGDDAERFYDTYQALQDGNNPLYAYLGLRYFELGLEFFLRRGVQIVFMFDEFDEFMRQMPPKFFQTLRGLRDNYKQQLSYLVFTREPLPRLIETLKIPRSEIESFIELFNDNLLYVGPYNDKDSRTMLERLSQNWQRKLGTEEVSFLLYATGRFAGLLRASYQFIDGLDLTAWVEHSEQLVTVLASKRPVRQECHIIWLSLTEIERSVLKTIAGFQPYENSPEVEESINTLVLKRLIRTDKAQKKLSIEPPLLRAYILSLSTV